MTEINKKLDYLSEYPTSETLLKIFAQDCSPIDETNYAYKMSTNAMLYSKYLTIFNSINEVYRKKEFQQEILASKLMRYYSGTQFDGEQILDKNLRPKTKTEIIKCIDLDVEYIKLKNEIKEMDILKQTITRILDFQTYQANNLNKFFDYVRYSQGVR